MRKEFETIEFDKGKNAVVITTQTHVSIDGAENIEEVKGKLQGRLREIVGLVKNLKAEAENIKSMLNRLEGKTESISVPVQSPE